MGKTFGWLGAVLLALLGCQPTETRIQPPPLHEEYRLPPDDDARFARPPEFPKEARREGLPKLGDGPGSGGPPPSLRGPGSPRLGGPGLGGY
jgi:hypothetical protein